VAPVVPRDFANGGAAGLVTVSMMIDEKGNVTETSVVKSTHKELEEPAMDAVKKWRFKPAKKDGSPVAVRVAIPIKFDVS
jgi:protein TonB